MTRILVIDDDEQIREVLRQMLEESHFEVVAAATGEEGLKLFRENPVDLVITDIFMPGEGGFEVIRKLKKDFPNIKIIAITGIDLRDGIDAAALAKKYGAHRAFEKPFTQEQIVEAVQELLEGD